MPNPAPNIDMLEAAVELAARGFRVFPVHTPKFRADGAVHCSCARADCDRIGKHPRTAKGLYDASADERQVREWWAKWPEANIGIRTGDGVMVLDIDTDKVGSSNGLDLPDTLRVVTGGGGEHWYLRCEGDVPNSVELVGPGLDVRGDGGYVLAPPSLHASGRRYTWDAGGGEDWADAPRWLLERARAKRQGATAEVSAADAWIAGGRNDALTSLAGSMRRRGMVESSIRAALLEENAARCRPALDEAEVRRIAEGVAKRYAPADPVKGWAALGWPEISQQLPNIPWLVEGLRIAPGAPLLVAGYGFVGKTVSLQALALAIATGTLAWGSFPVSQGPVVHVDYEQGAYLTRLRYQRLALAAGLWGPVPIELYPLPPTTLDTPDGAEKLRGVCEGKRLCIIDSLKAAFPKADENSSDVRTYLDSLTRVSEQTGCVMAVIHHARKPNKDNAGGAKMAIRGSGAIFDACGGVYVLEGTKGQPATVSHEKERVTGRPVEDFALAIEDVILPVEEIPEAAVAVTAIDGIASTDGLLRRGLRVRVAEIQRAPSALSAMMQRLLEDLRRRGPAKSKGELVLRTGVNRSIGWQAIAELIAEGMVTATRKGLAATEGNEEC